MFKFFVVLSIAFSSNAFADTYRCSDSEGSEFQLEVVIDIDGEQTFSIDGKVYDLSELDVRSNKDGTLNLWFLGAPGSDEQVNVCIQNIEN